VKDHVVVIAVAVWGLLSQVAAAQTAPALSLSPGLLTGQTAGPTMDLTADEAVARALERNLDLAVERLNPQTYDLSLAALRATYRPTLTSTIGQNSIVQLPTSQLTGGAAVESDTLTYNGGMAQALRWGGGSLTLGWTNRRQASTNVFTTFNPQYNTTLTASLTQPLLRGLRTDSTRTQLRVTSFNRDISEIQLRARVTTILANVRNAYWDLVAAMEAVDVARRSLDLAEKLIEDNRARVEVGTMAPIDVVQAEAEAATRRQTLASAEATWRTAELALKRLIVSGTDDPVWRARLNPIDRPTFSREAIDIDAAVRGALEKRTDLAQSRINLEINDLNVGLLRNQRLPGADLIATYGLQGIGGTRFVRTSAIGGGIQTIVPGGYGDALAALAQHDYPTWNVQVQFSYPVGQSAAEAQYARARVQMQQTQAQMKQLELQIATEVTNSGLTVESNVRRLEAAQAARQLAEKRLDAETSKFEVGMSTNFFVVQAQRDLVDAQMAELRALLDYRKSLVDFDRVQQTSLAGSGITLVSGGGGGTTTTTATRAGTGGGGPQQP
jgi:outer membrane protein TolC